MVAFVQSTKEGEFLHTRVGTLQLKKDPFLFKSLFSNKHNKNHLQFLFIISILFLTDWR
jgi:hypothetical protein